MLYSKETVTWAVALDKTIVCMGHKTWGTPDWASLCYGNCLVTNCKVLLEGNGKDSRNVRKGKKKRSMPPLLPQKNRDNKGDRSGEKEGEAQGRIPEIT